ARSVVRTHSHHARFSDGADEFRGSSAGLRDTSRCAFGSTLSGEQTSGDTLQRADNRPALSVIDSQVEKPCPADQRSSPGSCSLTGGQGNPLPPLPVLQVFCPLVHSAPRPKASPSLTTLPHTSVRRKSRLLWRWVTLVSPPPSRYSTVDWVSQTQLRPSIRRAS